MNILVLNLNSKLFKYELFDSVSLESVQDGEFEMEMDGNIDKEKIDKHFREMLRSIGDVTQIKAVGHRVVYGGEKYLETQLIDVSDLHNLESLNAEAPEHNPYNLAGILASNKYIPDTPDYAVFDTVFFKDLPRVAKIYSIPYEYFEQGVYKSGWHGILHKFAGEQAAKKIKTPFDKSNIISVYLDNESSVVAMAQGKPVDICANGLMMATSCGDVGHTAITYILTDLSQKEIDAQMVTDKLKEILNHKSGIKGVANKESYEDLLKGVQWGEERSKLALEIFVYQVKKCVGAQAAVLGEVDAIVFSGKMSIGKSVTRKKICDKIKILEDVAVMTVDVHEELAIAQEVKEKL